MEQDLDTIVQEHLAKLPAVSRQVLEEFDWVEKLQALGKRHGLLLDELEALQTETTLVLLGASIPESFQMNLRKQMGVTDKEAAQLVHDINATVFQPIHEMIIERSQETPKESAAKSGTVGKIQSEPADAESAPRRKDVLAEIENHAAPKETKKAALSPAHLKLNDMFTTKPESTKKTPAPITYENNSDPYHEPID